MGRRSDQVIETVFTRGKQWGCALVVTVVVGHAAVTDAAIAPRDCPKADCGQVVKEPTMSSMNSDPRWQNAETIVLWDASVPRPILTRVNRASDMPATKLTGIAEPFLKHFKPAKPNGRALLVMPGGGYRLVSTQNEGVELAERINAEGFDVFVLVYRLPSEVEPVNPMAPWEDAVLALRTIRQHSAQWRIDPKTVSVMGFSAGGHLAAWMSSPSAEKNALADNERPWTQALIYPVVRLNGAWAHRGSKEALLADLPADQVDPFNTDLQVDSKTPPTFLMHASDDKAVPIQNSFEYAKALSAHDRPLKLVVLNHGGHGFGVHAPESEGDWIAQWSRWVQEQAKLPH